MNLSFPIPDTLSHFIYNNTCSCPLTTLTHVYLSNICQAIHHQRLLPVVVVIQVEHGHAKGIDDAAAPGALIPGVKGVHDYGLCSFDLTATEGATLAI